MLHCVPNPGKRPFFHILCKQNASLYCAVHKTVDPPFKNALCYYRVAEGQWVESTSETGAKAKKC